MEMKFQPGLLSQITMAKQDFARQLKVLTAMQKKILEEKGVSSQELETKLGIQELEKHLLKHFEHFKIYKGKQGGGIVLVYQKKEVSLMIIPTIGIILEQNLVWTAYMIDLLTIRLA